jgi:peptidyl-Lys metalloendopeptidase
MNRNILITIGTATVLAAGIASVFAAAEAAARVERANPLRVSMMSLGDGLVEVVVTNTSHKTARIPKWQLPSTVALWLWPGRRIAKSAAVGMARLIMRPS